ncbi:GNAT family N-acetyltransferase [Zafaria sp. J156]|uniref:GNAT family N-acetyltransferase n=1 Tax=Zafaria sp. J156 TaxID=3116490 RepID=UPI002E771647|nr:GNAT family N-acetyltransferase [Zafaria sp. J156]MEE1621295.1 GNAT family N-acetyltransferase [Zafaria sp. J156]
MTSSTLEHAAPDTPGPAVDPVTAAGSAPSPHATPPAAGAFRAVDPDADAALLHAWIATEHARFWGMPQASVDEVRAEYRRIDADPHHHALIGRLDGADAFLLERYRPERSPLAGRYAWRDGDAGLHLLLPAPGDAPVAGFSERAMRASLEHVFADPGVLRVVVEPDARNTAVQALNARLGFRPLERIELPAADGQPAKRALLSLCTRDGFAAATRGPSTLAAHLDPQRWAAANRHVVAKAIAEFSHERLLEPVPADASPATAAPTAPGTPGPGGTRRAAPASEWVLESGPHRYRFAATRHALDHWRVDPASLVHEDGAGPADVDAQEFVVRFQSALGIADEQLPTYLEEIGSTLSSHCYKQLHSTATAAELAAGSGDPVADFQRIEAAMTEGHPCFVANNGRIGLGADDYLDYAPEAGAAVVLDWLAIHPSRGRYTAVAGLDHRALLAEELGRDTLAAFDAVLRRALAGTGHDASNYLYLPVHPWQWRNKLAVAFANDVARRHLVHLGSGRDLHQPQQSIRTFFNRSAPGKRYVKTALSVLNMGFMRGLSAQYMEATPAINAWLQGIVDADTELAERGVELLQEVAAVGYENPLFQAATTSGSPYRKMLAALWRESPADRLGPDESPATMASLLHVDHEGRSLAAALVRRSGLEPAEWIARYLDAYLVPLVHCLIAYDLAFMPHGENVILVLRDGVPVRVLHKDLAEEVAVLGDRMPLPEAVERIRVDAPDEERPMTIFTDVLDCFLRFLAPLLAAEGLLDEEEFWGVARGRLLAYRDRHPELAAEFDALGLFAPEFRLSCLNRLQLRNNQQMLDLADTVGGLVYAGTLRNPLAPPVQ